MSPSIRATILLADHAVVADGKLYINGGGWSVTGPKPQASALALKLDIPWDMTNQKMRFRLRLVDADGNPVTQPGREGERPVEVGGEFEVGRPSGLKAGVPIDMSLALGIPPLRLPSGQRFSWFLTIDDETAPDWHVSFQTR
ncbi:MAG: hypothetical protein QM621_06970 [Aeromicrobium sp.]|uniref:DUF6941 family protein n=1 Tax=Aeromicrobium sp. TaxID=1871063 RepID=UPI0039E6B00A